jgi:hypothetical protein
MEILQDMPEDAKVFIMSQQSWPFENAVSRVTTRLDMGQFDDEDDAPKKDNDGEMRPTDVFIVEGQQIRYGDKAAWD